MWRLYIFTLFGILPLSDLSQYSYVGPAGIFEAWSVHNDSVTDTILKKPGKKWEVGSARNFQFAMISFSTRQGNLLLQLLPTN